MPPEWPLGPAVGHILHNTLLGVAKLSWIPRTYQFGSLLPPRHKIVLTVSHILQGRWRTEGTADGWETTLSHKHEKDLLVQSKRSFCVWDKTHSPIKKRVPGSKNSTKSLPKLKSLTIHSYSLPPFACFSEPHRLTPAAFTHQTLIPQLSASSLQTCQVNGVLDLVQMLQR